MKLGLDPKWLDVHLVQKGSNIHEENERRAMAEKKPSFVIIIDQGSRGGPPVVEDVNVRCLVLGHQLSDEFPENAVVSLIVSCLTYFEIVFIEIFVFDTFCKFAFS